jgi:ferredoxin
MKIEVDRQICESHGQCAIFAQDVFRLDDDLTLHYDENPDEAHREDVEEAIAACPTQAIRELLAGRDG